MDVSVTDDGQLQLIIDQRVYPPVPIDAVQAMYARIPDAEAASARAELTAAMRALTGVLATSADLVASFTISANTATVTVDPATFATIQTRFAIIPDPDTGTLIMGPVTIWEGA